MLAMSALYSESTTSGKFLSFMRVAILSDDCNLRLIRFIFLSLVSFFLSSSHLRSWTFLLQTTIHIVGPTLKEELLLQIRTRQDG